MRRGPLSLAALLLLAACATAPEPRAEAVDAAPGATERYAPLIEQQAMKLAGAEPAGAVPAGLQITILSVDETPARLFYSAELRAPGRRRRQEQEYVIYGQCAATELAACASQIVSGARLLAGPAR